MNWVAVILAVFKAVAAAVEYLRQKQALDAASTEIFGRYAKGAMDEIRDAKAARAAVQSDILLHPERLRDDDRFRRD